MGDQNSVPSGTGSQASPSAAPRLRPEGVDPSRGPWIVGLETAPTDGTPILAGMHVYRRNEDGTLTRYEDVHPDCDHGWRWEDYEFWQPIAALPEREQIPATNKRGGLTLDGTATSIPRASE